MTAFEYTQMTCDVWQMHHLANRWADAYGWEVVSVVPLPAGMDVPERVGDEDSPSVRASIQPVALLFRRPVPAEPS